MFLAGRSSRSSRRWQGVFLRIRFAHLSDRLAQLSGRFAHLGGRFAHLGGRFAHRRAGDLRSLAGDFRILAGDLRILAGNFRILAGNFRILAGDLRTSRCTCRRYHGLAHTHLGHPNVVRVLACTYAVHAGGPEHGHWVKGVVFVR